MRHKISSVNNVLVSDCSGGNITDIHVALSPSRHFQDVTWHFRSRVRVSNSGWLYCRPSQDYMVMEKEVGCETLICIKTHHVRSKWVADEGKENLRFIKSLSSYSTRTWARSFPKFSLLHIKTSKSVCSLLMWVPWELRISALSGRVGG